MAFNERPPTEDKATPKVYERMVDGDTDYDWVQYEAAKVKRKAKQHGTITLVLDAEGRFHSLPGCAEIVGVYDSNVDVGALVSDLGL